MIYNKSTRELVKEFLKDFVPPQSGGFRLTERRPLADGGFFTRKECISWFFEHYPKIKSSTVSAHLGLLSTNFPSRVHHTLRAGGQDDLLYKTGPSKYRIYNPETDPSPIYPGQENADMDNVESDRDESSDSKSDGREFAYEEDLKKFLAKNMELIQPGLRLYEEEGVTGVEYPVGGRFIDILAVDGDSLVVIELKVSRGYDRVMGQLLRYMGWIRKELAEPGQNVRGIIIARSISEDLQLAASLVKGVQLMEYELQVALQPVDTM